MGNYVYYNPNPRNSRVGDCVVRAISKVLGISWRDAFMALCNEAYDLCDMPSANVVWGSLLDKKGFEKRIVPATCPNCYTVSALAEELPKGRYVLCTGSHVVAVVDNKYYDSWNSGDEVPLYYWKRSK